MHAEFYVGDINRHTGYLRALLGASGYVHVNRHLQTMLSNTDTNQSSVNRRSVLEHEPCPSEVMICGVVPDAKRSTAECRCLGPTGVVVRVLRGNHVMLLD